MKKFFIMIIIFELAGWAAPALQKQKTLTQANGTQFKAQPKGNEFLHYFQTKEGAILKYNPKTKNYDYAAVRNDRLVPSGIPYKPNQVQKASALKQVISPSMLQHIYEKQQKRWRH